MPSCPLLLCCLLIASAVGRNTDLKLPLLLHVFALLAAALLLQADVNLLQSFLAMDNPLLILRPLSCNPLFASMEQL